ncbi:class I SAM-dependent methyltransferase [Nocardia brasiliensis]
MTSQFDTAAHAYEASATAIPIREYIEEPSIRALCGDLHGRLALDLGCGTGLYTRRLARWGAKQVIGADISEGMLAEARAIENADPLGITYLQRDLTEPCRCDEEYAHLSGQIDLTLAVYALCYATTGQDLEAMCRTAKQDLKPGGVFLASTMNPEYADENEHPGYYSDYYASYGFSMSAISPPVEEGSTVVLSMRFPEESGVEPVALEAVWWSAKAYETALRAAGFTSIAWHRMQVSAEGQRAHPAPFWDRYLARPHALVLEAQ